MTMDPEDLDSPFISFLMKRLHLAQFIHEEAMPLADILSKTMISASLRAAREHPFYDFARSRWYIAQNEGVLLEKVNDIIFKNPALLFEAADLTPGQEVAVIDRPRRVRRNFGEPQKAKRFKPRVIDDVDAAANNEPSTGSSLTKQFQNPGPPAAKKQDAEKRMDASLIVEWIRAAAAETGKLPDLENGKTIIGDYTVSDINAAFRAEEVAGIEKYGRSFIPRSVFELALVSDTATYGNNGLVLK